jgi:YesN/AraC family two-component response regulator
LLVEDDVITLEIYTTILTKKYPDVPVYPAINGRAGFDLFKVHLPAIVITDIVMPEMDGVQLASKIRALKPETRFIFLTGNSQKNILHDLEGNEFEFYHHIVKPVNFGELFAAIEQCLGEIAPAP